MKRKGSSFEYKEERDAELLRAWREQLAIRHNISIAEVAVAVAESPCKRFWVSEERAEAVVASLERGRTMERMSRTRREMFEEIFNRYTQYRKAHPNATRREAVWSVVGSPAPRFYLTPDSVKILLHRARKEEKRRCLESRKTSVVYACYALLAVLSLFSSDGYGLHAGCAWHERMLYPFLHANIFHALVNIYVLELCRRAMPMRWQLAALYAIAVSYPFSGTTPVIGLSGVVYAYMGCVMTRARNKMRFNLFVVAYLFIGMFFAVVAVRLHAYCYALGMLYGYITLPACNDK